jgi:hypothetical protein
MNYKSSSAGMQVMNANNHTRIPLMKRCDFLAQLDQNNKVYGANSNYHSVTYRPPGGISDYQIEVLREQFKRDIQGPNAIAARGTFSVEGEEDDRHVHIALVLNNRDRTTPTSKRYKAALGATHDDANEIALICKQPPTNKMKNYTQLCWLAYPCKMLAAGPDGLPVTPNIDVESGGAVIAIGLFDGLTGEALNNAKRIFSNEIKTAYSNKLLRMKTKHITTGNMHKLAKHFIATHRPNLVWTNDPRTRAEVIATMVQFEGSGAEYELSKGFLKERYALDRLNMHKEDEDYHDQLVAAINRTFDIIDAPGQGATARNNSTRLLHVQIKELKRQIMLLEDQNSYNVRERAERRAADDERARKRMKLS